ncbi:MAG: RNB domain-containing ribonuclease [Sulfuricellaceae bacterium]|nr:RNB domain-containing ribonuclease [Sulfuricellaceae bacterium]
MNIFYEEDGSLKAASVMADNDTSLQVETPHGKRAKIKASNVLLKFAQPAANGFVEAAEQVAAEIDPDFLWECCGEVEFGFGDLAREYFGHEPTPVEAAAAALKLHGAPMYFYKKGKGRYKAAPAENLKAALAGAERKRLQEQKKAEYLEQLKAFQLPPDLQSQLNMLLYKPDKNSLEYKALEQACSETGLPPHKLLEKCGAIASPHDFHLNRFLAEHFPRGHGFAALEMPEALEGLPQSDARAFSIDDASTTEIDDAFSVHALPNGHWRVGVHIAAPALGILPGSPLDMVASDRLSTVYMPGGKITMLPDALVERFTLQEGRSCPALSMYLEVDPADFSIVASESRVERVEVAANLRHDTLEPFFNEETLRSGASDFPFGPELQWLWRFADKLEESRGRPDAGKTFQPDFNFSVRDGHVTISQRQRGTPIDKVVSELMIGVNSRWAKLLAENKLAAIFRAQEAGKVRMTTVPAPHKGMGLDLYMWSSSPLRRYIDLINQRQLLALLQESQPYYTARDEALLAAMRGHELASDAYNAFQRSMERYWSLRYLLQENIATAPAVVVKENLIRFENLPLFTRLTDMPDTAPGSLIEVEVGAVDLLDLEFGCKFRAALGVAD